MTSSPSLRAIRLPNKVEDEKRDEIKPGTSVDPRDNGALRKKARRRSNNTRTEEYPNRLGMKLPIVYPPEMKGQFLKFLQWKKINNVLSTKSEVLILDEDEYNLKVYIPSACLGFKISLNKVEIINPKIATF